MNDSIQKRCTYCQEFFPATLQYFYKHNQCPDGLQPRCKKCFGKGRQPREGYVNGLKRCKRCNTYLPPTRDYFWYYPDSIDKLTYACIKCLKEADEKSRRAKGIQPQKPADPNTRIENYKRNKQSIIARANQWRKNNPEKRREVVSNYDKSNRGRITKRKNARLRIARKTANVPYEPFTPDDVLALLKEQNYQCYYCQCDISNKYHIDHYIPLAKGGSHSLANIVLACPTCNIRKHDKMPEDFHP